MKIIPARLPFVAFVALLAAGLQLTGAAQETTPGNEVQKAFVKGGRVYLHLSAGDYTIRGGAADTVRVHWKTRDPRDMDSAGADVSISGVNATIRTRGPKNNFKVTIDLPQRADLDIELSAGDLKVGGIEGNKTLSMWAGDVTIEVGDADLYKQVDATVRAGEISAHPFGRTTGGLFRSLHWKGAGKYTLHARLTAGDLKLVR